MAITSCWIENTAKIPMAVETARLFFKIANVRALKGSRKIGDSWGFAVDRAGSCFFLRGSLEVQGKGRTCFLESLDAGGVPGCLLCLRHPSGTEIAVLRLTAAKSQSLRIHEEQNS